MNTAEQNYRLLQEIDANRRFLLMAYQQNPKLLERAEPRVRQLFETMASRGHEELRAGATLRQRGISLIELIMFIVIVSTALAGILLVMNQVMAHSADPLVRKQALAVAESMLEEIRLQDLAPGACTGALAPGAIRTGVGCVNDYNGYNSNGGGILGFSDNGAVPGLGSYNITNVAVTNLSAIGAGTFGGTAINAGSGVEITVTVADPTGATIEATGYRAGK
jgi:MSHA pilin protein MshD